MDAKWLKTMQAYEEYERRFAAARLEKSTDFSADEAARLKMIEQVRRMLAYDESLVPEVHNMTEISRCGFETYDVIQYRYETWERSFVSATMYMPHGEGKVPLIIEFCGHGAHGRLTPSYRKMAHQLAASGFAVMVPDNMGQGDREAFGHTHCIAPFACGLTLQGMIIMESVALIRYMQKHPRVDAARIGSCGNSGGGTLNLLLCAMAPELAAIAATGYPSEFHYILAKERRHCACNLLPGCVRGPEMWEILSAFAPKPLLIEQGENDHLIPFDYFQRCARKVSFVYRSMSAEAAFVSKTAKTLHPWDTPDIRLIAQFFCDVFGMNPAAECGDIIETYDAEAWHVPMPPEAKTTDEIAEQISGVRAPQNLRLQDIFPPQLDGAPLSEAEIVPDIGRGDVMRILAQMECALTVRD